MIARQILNESYKLMHNDRQETYGDAKANHERIAKLWSIILDTDISAEQVALCMVGVKLSRLSHDPSHLDSYIDGAAYFAIAGEIANHDTQ